MIAHLLLHSWGTSAREWDAVVAGLDGPVLALDLPGFGGAPPRVESPDVADYVEDVLRDARDLGSYVLVGHSMGGKVAQALAARRPSGLAGLVLVAPSPLSPEPMADEERARLAGALGDRAAIERVVDGTVAAPLAPDLRAAIVAEYLRVAPSAWRGWLEVGSREDLRALAGEIDVPTLVLVGERDPVMAREMLLAEVAEPIVGATMEIVADAGHLLPLEAPAALAARLNAFRASLGPPRLRE